MQHSLATRVRKLACRFCMLFPILACSSYVRGEDKQEVVQVIRRSEIPFPKWQYQDYAITKDIQVWIREYQAIGDDFELRNRLAFRLAQYHDMWTEIMSFMSFDPKTDDETFACIVHFFSAFSTKHFGQVDSGRALNIDSSWIVAGQLKLLRAARPLNPDLSDHAWPNSGVLFPRQFPKHIAAVLNKHPVLAIDVAQTLEVYGPLALKEARVLVPLLVADDLDVVAAAQTAIRKMDPQGLSKTFQLDGQTPLTMTQRESIRDYLDQPTVVDTRESDGSPQSEMSKGYEELLNFISQQSEFPQSEDPLDIYLNPVPYRNLARRFRDEKPPGKWWNILMSANCSLDFWEEGDLIRIFALALATEPGSLTDLIELLDDDDPVVVRRAMHWICFVRPFQFDAEEVKEVATDEPDVEPEEESEESKEGDDYYVDPENMPSRFARVLKRFPHFYNSVASCLGVYRTHSVKFTDILVPHLLSDDPYEVALTRSVITRINPDLAKDLEIVREKFEYLQEQHQGMVTLSPKQRELVQAYLDRQP